MDPKKFFQIGTPLCGLTFGLIGVIIAVLLLYIGLWRTLFIAAFFGAGYFLGVTSDKGETIKNLINKLFPPRNE